MQIEVGLQFSWELVSDNNKNLTLSPVSLLPFHSRLFPLSLPSSPSPPLFLISIYFFSSLSPLFPPPISPSSLSPPLLFFANFHIHYTVPLTLRLPSSPVRFLQYSIHCAPHWRVNSYKAAASCLATPHLTRPWRTLRRILTLALKHLKWALQENRTLLTEAAPHLKKLSRSLFFCAATMY